MVVRAPGEQSSRRRDGLRRGMQADCIQFDQSSHLETAAPSSCTTIAAAASSSWERRSKLSKNSHRRHWPGDYHG